MRKTILIGLAICIFLVSIVNAIPNPSLVYCEERGYIPISIAHPLASTDSGAGEICAITTGSLLCAPCGNGICDAPAENRCNCQIDCPSYEQLEQPIQTHNLLSIISRWKADSLDISTSQLFDAILKWKLGGP